MMPTFVDLCIVEVGYLSSVVKKMVRRLGGLERDENFDKCFFLVCIALKINI